MRILLVEDDPVIARQAQKSIEADGHKVDVALDGDSGWNLAVQNSYGLALLDVMVPGIDGTELCRRIRAAGYDMPVMMLTARDTADDIVVGLDAGADDYLVKPYDIRVLKARIRALARRESAVKTQTLEIGDLVIDTRAKSVKRGGRAIDLTPREFALLEALARRRDQILTRDVILERVWNDDRSLLNTVNFHVSSLRKKINNDFDIKLIHTAHGLGYVLRTPDAPENP